MNPLDIILIIVFSILYVWSLYNIPILIAGVKSLRSSGQEVKKTPKSNEKELPKFSIIVPAKDEEKVLGRLLNALLKLEYPVSCSCSKTICSKGLTAMSPFVVLEKIGSISFGCSLVAGNRRVPKPAAGTTTFLIIQHTYTMAKLPKRFSMNERDSCVTVLNN